MSEHEQQDEPGTEDLEPTAEQAEQIAGGAVSISDIVITKTTDKPSPTLP